MRPCSTLFDDGVVITDIHRKILLANKGMEKTFGYLPDDLKGKTTAILYADSEKYETTGKNVFNEGSKPKDRIYMSAYKHRSGRVFSGETFGTKLYDQNNKWIGNLGIMRDISDKTLLEGQLQQAQKMEAVGRLTGGVAHDFNNTLAIIIGYAEMALEDIEPTKQLHGDLTKILDAAERSANIVRQLLAFSRKQTAMPKVLDLNKAVKALLKILHRLLGEDIEVSWIPGLNLSPVKMDPIQIDQILANLCVNSKDAMAGPGKITIETSMVTLDSEYCDNNIGFQPGRFVQLSVSDSGCGFDKETQDHIFEPFFSTKELGKGTGLGLSTVYGIVKQNNGFINVYSEPGRGTIFKIYIPACQEELFEVKEQIPMEIGAAQGETVLLVEDEPVLLEMAEKMLVLLGYNVLTANRPSEALRIAADSAGTIDLLFTDVVMPEMTGKELAKRIHVHYPGLKVLFMSGYTANVIAHNGILNEGLHFIQKPYSVGDLAHKLRDILRRELPKALNE